jgi:hypothetical protein
MTMSRILSFILLFVALTIPASACLIYSQNPPSGPDCADAGVDACDEHAQEPAFRGPGLKGLSAKPHPAASCVFCADTGGKNDVKHLCSQSAAAWKNLETCLCQTHCASVCGNDWCARLGDVNYPNASDECNACAIAPDIPPDAGTAGCYDELVGCSDAM